MKMKNLIVIIVTAMSCQLVGCNITDNFSPLDSQANYLTDKKYGLVENCKGSLMSLKPILSEAENFWKKNNLPYGTTEFVCKDGKAYLPNKVTDCQGNNISRQQGGLDLFRNKYSLKAQGSDLNIRFKCEGGNVRYSE